MFETLTMPDGSEFAIVSSSADPAHDPSEMQFTVLAHGQAPPPHVHVSQRETFTALEGDSFEIRLGRRWQRLSPGESITVEPGQTHTFRNNGPDAVRVRTVHDPGLSFERYIRRLHATACRLGTTKITPGMAIRFAILWREHAETIRPGPLPLRAAMAVLAGVGRLARMQPEAY